MPHVEPPTVVVAPRLIQACPLVVLFVHQDLRPVNLVERPVLALLPPVVYQPSLPAPLVAPLKLEAESLEDLNLPLAMPLAVRDWLHPSPSPKLAVALGVRKRCLADLIDQ